MILRQLPYSIVQDDLSRHALAYREIYLLLRRPHNKPLQAGSTSSRNNTERELSAGVEGHGIPPVVAQQ